MPTCRACGTLNPDRAKFCQECGAALSSTGTRSGEERKLVTALFCDLVGFTAASDGADPEDMQARLAAYFPAARAEIERYGGVVEKFIGDAVVGVFGVPAVHEDDAERAVRAALAIVGAIERTNERRPSLRLAVRVGVNSGEAVVSLHARPETGAGFITGDAINAAARLQGTAPEGGVVVGAATYRLTRDRFRWARMDPVAVKGKAEPLERWIPVEAVAGVRRAGRGAWAPFVGRQEELAAIARAANEALGGEGARLLTIAGEPGVGKSRLIAEIGAAIPGLAGRLWSGRCLPYGEGVTFWAVGELVRAICGIEESDVPEGTEARVLSVLDALVADPSDRRWLAGRLIPLVGGEPNVEDAVRGRESRTAWLRFLWTVAANRPAAVVFDDLHWADEPLLAFVRTLASDAPPESALLVICAGRPDLYERAPTWGREDPLDVTVTLGPLDGEQTGALVSHLLGDVAVAPDLLTTLAERSGGNPLYAEQIAGMLLDRAAATGRPGVTASLAGVAAAGIPETLHALISARLDTLPDQWKGIVQDASVVGRMFWSGAVASMGAREPAEVELALQALIRKDLIRAPGNHGEADRGEHAFAHGLVRDVAYGEIPRHVRARKHEAVARWIEQRVDERPGAVEFAAHHFAVAFELARAAGDADLEASTRGPAIRWLLRAGDRSMGLDVAQARASYLRALALAPGDHPMRGRILMALGRARSRGGDHAGAVGAYEEAVELLRRQNDRQLLGGALRRLAAVHRERGETAVARTLLADALAVLQDEPPGEELCWACYLVAFDRYASGSQEEALEWANQALRVAADRSLPEAGFVALQVRGIIRCELDDLGGLDDLRTALANAEREGFDHRIPLAHENLAEARWFAESAAAGLESYKAGAAFGVRRGISVSYLEAVALRPLFDLGRWDEVVERADAWIGALAQGGAAYWRPVVVAYRAMVDLWRARATDGVRLNAALAEARETGDAQVLVPALAAAALAAASTGRFDGVTALVEEFDDLTRDRFQSQRSVLLADLVRACVAAGRLDAAERLTADAPTGFARLRNELTSARAAIAEARRDLGEAARLYRQAASGWNAYQHVLEEAIALAGEARCLSGDGAPDGVSLEGRARELFDSLGVDRSPISPAPARRPV
jgi:class 3 adenylate cyclase/tetratricopeptide (TPR) repeat protein